MQHEKIERRSLRSKSDRSAEAKSKENDLYEDYESGQSRECVAIFNPIDPEADKITVEVFGLVNDISMEKIGDGRLRITERVLRLTFHRPGDEFYTSLDKFKFIEKKWGTVTRTVQVPVE